eukprot:CAMPEP_0119014938 /NCGR_PEP_ID=MMETSP1176-20130426/10469_1 /TAXON_ID=265551 /ORGANISM="Synedropsis recta cf, Strain CCMP1620" /LENGTH=594 /DNA_ID=CAMNT_0006968189 /DNA_START=16 /DNA_END=1800 /DNA_ORIENTATION=+
MTTTNVVRYLLVIAVVAATLVVAADAAATSPEDEVVVASGSTTTTVVSSSSNLRSRRRQLNIPDPKTIAMKPAARGSLSHTNESHQLTNAQKASKGYVGGTPAVDTMNGGTAAAAAGNVVTGGTTETVPSSSGSTTTTKHSPLTFNDVKHDESTRPETTQAAAMGMVNQEVVQQQEAVATDAVQAVSTTTTGGRVQEQQATPVGITETAAAMMTTTDTATPKTTTERDTSNLSRRKFLAYVPSPWESVWKEGIAEWETSLQICDIITGDSLLQAAHLRKYLDVLCTKRYAVPNQNWCYLFDGKTSITYNMANTKKWEFYVNQTPEALKGRIPPQTNDNIPIAHVPGLEDTFSKFVFLDEVSGEVYYEYIEPLVSALRFPLSQCLWGVSDNMNWFTGYVIPPPSPAIDQRHKRKLYFEYGGDRWKRFEYVIQQWWGGGGGGGNNAIEWDAIYATDTETPDAKFYESFPPTVQEKVKRIASSSSSANGAAADASLFDQYIPNVIHTEAKPNDYVLLKLGKGDPSKKEHLIQYILENDDVHVDEIVWQHNLAHNYLLKNLFDTKPNKQIVSQQQTFSDSYSIFSRLRQKGIRAHAWV